MSNQRTHATTLLLGALLAFAAPLWADREERVERPVHREPRAQQRDERREAPGHSAQPAKLPESARERRAPADRGRQQETTHERRTGAEAPRHRLLVSDNRGASERERPRDESRDSRRNPQPEQIKNWRQENPAVKTPPKPGYVLDSRHQHNHYYPPRGHIVPVLPPAHHVVTHRHEHYHYHDGIWYRPYNSHFIVVLPPFGLFVPILPPFYSVLRVSSTTYYYAGGVYYNWYPEQQSYVVVEAPPEKKVQIVSSGSDQLFIYPKAGQSEEQQARDRYECHSWANNQTGFDPTLPGGGVAEAQHASKRADYFRAMKACLEARHYSVQ